MRDFLYEGERDNQNRRYDLLKVFMHPAFDSMGLQSEVNIPTTPVVDVVLVEHIIQALIQVFQI